jgi:hypothetical protein
MKTLEYRSLQHWTFEGIINLRAILSSGKKRGLVIGVILIIQVKNRINLVGMSQRVATFFSYKFEKSCITTEIRVNRNVFLGNIAMAILCNIALLDCHYSSSLLHLPFVT